METSWFSSTHQRIKGLLKLNWTDDKISHHPYHITTLLTTAKYTEGVYLTTIKKHMMRSCMVDTVTAGPMWPAKDSHCFQQKKKKKESSLLQRLATDVVQLSVLIPLWLTLPCAGQSKHSSYDEPSSTFFYLVSQLIYLWLTVALTHPGANMLSVRGVVFLHFQIHDQNKPSSEGNIWSCSKWTHLPCSLWHRITENFWPECFMLAVKLFTGYTQDC